ncbi:MAG TPA: hypothetical protein VL551_16195 [Actinospica sp.]|jgi:hypothetical protein|nr:hypothetical protein [Actinospica sp.]
MRKIISGAVAVPITAALLIAATGCSGSSATSAAAPTHSATGVATAAAAPPSSAAASATQQQSATSAEPVSDSSGGTGKPFPGIWDITSWKQLYAMEASVSQGHQPWLLDPSMVVQAWAAQWKVNLPVRQVGPDTFQVVKPGTNTTYTVRGTRPDPTNASPIWVITSITHD